MSDRRASRFSLLAFAVVAVALYLVASCSQDPGGVDSGATESPTATSAPMAADPEPTTGAAVSAGPSLPPEGNPELLSEWGQLEIGDGRLVLADGVTPYALNSTLFSDYAHKLRTVWLPDGADPAVYDPDETFAFPVGTVITKTFYYPVEGEDAGDRVLKVTSRESLAEPLDLATVRLLETRVLVHRADGWHALPYVWNDDETEATLQRTGDIIGLTLVDGDTQSGFAYVVPDVNQCSSCHATNHSTAAIVPIGPKARHLNTDVDLGDGMRPQLAVWAELGLVDLLPDRATIPAAAVWSDDTADLDDRARAYLDINCSHCHNERGSADTSGLLLEPGTELGQELGVCKQPIAAGTGTGGRPVGIFPGDPDQSIFVYRMQTLDPGAMMPEVGRSLEHTEGVELIAGWIESLVGGC